MRRDVELEATIVEKFAAAEAVLYERGRRLWAAAESRAIGYGLIGNTRTAAGSRVKAKLDKSKYSKGIVVTKSEMDALSLHQDECRGEWSYELRPRAS